MRWSTLPGIRAAGVLVRERFSEINPGEMTGYAVALPGCTRPDGTPRWSCGGRLHDTLTLPRLRAAWSQQQTGAERSGMFRFTAPERIRSPRHGLTVCHLFSHGKVGGAGRRGDSW